MKKHVLEQVTAAAVSLFIRQGFRQTKISNIAENAGIATGTVYNYFTSKEAIWNYLFFVHLKIAEEPTFPIVEMEQSSLHKMIEKTFEEQDTELKKNILREECRFEELIDRLIDRMTEYRAVFLMIEKNKEVDPLLTEIYRKYRYQLFSYVELFFDREMKAGRIRQLTHQTYHVELVIESIARMVIYKKYEAFVEEDYEISSIRQVLKDMLTHAYLLY
ncbi:TetR/AcrR family transcriptional regulator [Enterococcus sp. LJL51]|uniref:TetR/AcrR family transcriptional regulator n=1 Tax=Enterococcus sp. LJL51 TaxID=3416656 RepID=UPI003CFA57B5